MSGGERALAQLARDILVNVAMMGIGLALYKHEWWCLWVAAAATGIAVLVIWRAYD